MTPHFVLPRQQLVTCFKITGENRYFTTPLHVIKMSYVREPHCTCPVNPQCSKLNVVMSGKQLVTRLSESILKINIFELA